MVLQLMSDKYNAEREQVTSLSALWYEASRDINEVCMVYHLTVIREHMRFVVWGKRESIIVLPVHGLLQHRMFSL